MSVTDPETIVKDSRPEVGDRVIVRTPFSRTDRLCTIRRVNPDRTYAVDDGHPTDLDGWLGRGWRYAEADVPRRCIRYPDLCALTGE